MTKKVVCKIEECSMVAKSRGICVGHYSLLRVKVRRGDFSWEQLNKLGITVEPKNKAGQYKASFDRMFSKANDKLDR